jgi:hypothetical protein
MSRLDESAAKRGRGALRKILFAVLAGVGVLLLLLVGILVLDPFNLHLLDRLRGDYDAALAAIPQDSTLYVGFNLLSPSRDGLEALQETFRAAASGSAADPDVLRRDLDEALLRDAGISIEDDVIPWMGQYVGVAAVSVRLNDFGEFSGFDWLVSIETRNPAASDRFLDKLAQGWGESQGETARPDAYDGVVLTQFEQVTFGRSRRLVLLGSTADVVQRAIDAQGGSSLADSPGYADAIARLPGERLVTAYTNGVQFNELIASIPTALPQIRAENLPTASILGAALALSAGESALQIDTATVYDLDQFSDLQRTALETRVEDPVTAGIFPADTLLFLPGKGIDLFWAGLRRSLIAELGRSDFEESMGLFQREFGIDLDQGLFPLLTGEAAIGLVPSRIGTVASRSGVDLGVVAAIGTGEQDSLANNLASFSNRIGAPIGGLGLVSSFRSEQQVTIYEFRTILIPDLLVSYGHGNGYFLLGTSSEMLQAIDFGGQESLATTAAYQAVWSSFPADWSPGLFVNVTGLSELLRGATANGTVFAGATEVFRPIVAVASASNVENSVALTRVIILVDSG